jgi:hypothetical protein
MAWLGPAGEDGTESVNWTSSRMVVLVSSFYLDALCVASACCMYTVGNFKLIIANPPQKMLGDLRRKGRVFSSQNFTQKYVLCESPTKDEEVTTFQQTWVLFRGIW